MRFICNDNCLGPKIQERMERFNILLDIERLRSLERRILELTELKTYEKSNRIIIVILYLSVEEKALSDIQESGYRRIMGSEDGSESFLLKEVINL